MVVLENVVTANMILAIVQLIFQMIAYSLICLQTINKLEYIVYIITLLYYVGSNGVVTVLVITISDANDLPENYKDLAILQCSTAIALGIFVMDMINRAYDSK